MKFNIAHKDTYIFLVFKYIVYFCNIYLKGLPLHDLCVLQVFIFDKQVMYLAEENATGNLIGKMTDDKKNNNNNVIE